MNFCITPKWSERGSPSPTVTSSNNLFFLCNIQNEQNHRKRDLSVSRLVIHQTRMRSHSVELYLRIYVRDFVSEQQMLWRDCAEPGMFAYIITKLTEKCPFHIGWLNFRYITFDIWTASSEFGTYRLCEQRRLCASAQSRQNLRCSLTSSESREP